MKTNRPKIKVPYEALDIIIDLISATLLILLIIYTLISYSDLPEIIPSHFNAKGEVDGYNSKNLIWLLPIIGIVSFMGLFILNKYPHIHNYMVNITEDNALKNYRLSTRIVRFTNLFVIIIFVIVNYTIIASAQSKTINLGEWFVPTIVITSILIPVFILVYHYKINRS